ncbi:MAG: Ldh family oxidoreductase [Chloroflexota bacterium]
MAALDNNSQEMIHLVLPRFRVPEDLAVRVKQEDMRATLEDMFRKVGMPDDDAAQSADVLMFADLRAIETHGVSNMMRAYVQGFANGSINPKPDWRIIREAPATATIDGDGGHGLVIGPKAMDIAIDKANTYGIGSVSVTNGRHFGAAAYHAMRALPHDMIGVAMTVGGTMVVPTWGAEPRVGANPIAFAAPTRNEPPFVFDASMSNVAGNKVRLAQRLKTKMMPGWLTDAEGNPIMEETDVPEKYYLLPAGGTRELGGHKGYGLTVMVDILSGVLSGTGCAYLNRGASHHFMVYKVDAFTDVAKFKDDMDAFMKALKETPPAPGHDRVMYAGLPEHEDEIERRANGIPYHPEVIDWFREVTSEFDIPWRLTRD